MKSRASARALIFDDNNTTIYLIHRIKDGREYYVIPGGGVEESETPEETVKREILEETGIIMSNLKRLPDFKFSFNNRIDHFNLFSANVKKQVKYTGEELQNKYPNNFYELVKFPISELDTINLKPEELQDKIKKLI